MKHTKETLIAFEEDIAQCFNDKKIKAPIHLYHGNEEQMMKVFENIGEDDWVFCTWRSHYQALLKGVPPEELKQAILDGKSIALCFPKYKMFSSAIVTGNIPIALGVALAIKRREGKEKVHCFIGDMTAETGTAWECFKYGMQLGLPIRFIIEDNNKSVCTDTRKVWKSNTLTFDGADSEFVYHYKYESKWNHAGTNIRIQF
jgi:pyruvate dehydrogenase E1 component alpha subunit